jgi:hypothetical protein
MGLQLLVTEQSIDTQSSKLPPQSFSRYLLSLRRFFIFFARQPV